MVTKDDVFYNDPQTNKISVLLMENKTSLRKEIFRLDKNK